MISTSKPRLRVGYVGVAFGTYFAEEHDQLGRAVRGLEQLAADLNFDLVAVDHLLEDVEDARATASQLRTEGLDFLLIQAAAVASGELVEPLSTVAPRIGLWGTPDPNAEGPIQLHSLVAVNHYASILTRHLGDRGVNYKWFFGHLEDEPMRRRLSITIRALAAIKALASSRIGWIGGLSPGFDNMAFDEAELTGRLGISIGTNEISEVVERATRIAESAAQQVNDHAHEIATSVTAPPIGFERNSRIYLALREMVAEYGYDALAVQCWPSFQDQWAVAPCMAYSLLGSEDGLAVSCEGDVPGAATMLMLNALSPHHGSSTLLDLTALDPANSAAMLWHCGVTPRHFAHNGEIAWVDHVTLGRKSDVRLGVSGDLVIEPQPTTIAYAGDRFSELLIVEADVVDTGHAGFDGTRGWFANFRLNGDDIELGDLVNTLIVGGHEHHVAVGQGSYGDELLEIAAWLGLGTTTPIPQRDYVQIKGVNA